MVKNPADAAAVMPPSAASPDQSSLAAAALPLTTNMTASSLTSGGNSCLDEQIERLKRCEYLREGEVKALCLRAREILVDESNVQRVDAPVTVRCFVWTTKSALYCVCLFICYLLYAVSFLPVSTMYVVLDMRRHSWSVLRLSGTIQGWRGMP